VFGPPDPTKFLTNPGLVPDEDDLGSSRTRSGDRPSDFWAGGVVSAHCIKRDGYRGHGWRDAAFP